MFRATSRTLSKMRERVYLAEAIERMLGTSDPTQVETLLKEKPPLEVLQILEKANNEAFQKYKNQLRSIRRELDRRETLLFGAGGLATIFVLISLIFTLLRSFSITIIFSILAIIAGSSVVLLYRIIKKLREKSEIYLSWTNEHSRDAQFLSLAVSATSKISIEDAQTVLRSFLFTEEI